MSRKFRKYAYGQNKINKKVILIVAFTVLVLIGGIAALFLSKSSELSDNTATLQSAPTKTTYYVGDTPSWDGLALKITSPNGTSMTYGPNSCTITGFDSSKPAENQVITVKYQNHTATFTVTILEKDTQKPQGLFLGITFKTQPKTQYRVGEALDITGVILTKHYSDETTLETALTADMVSGFHSAQPGTYMLTVVYTENGTHAELTYEITVTD